MTETTAPEVAEPNTTSAAVDMVVENADVPAVDSAMKDETSQKRARDDDEKGVSKKQKVKAIDEEEDEEKEEEEKKPSGPVKLGYKTFASSLELFDYFNSFLHAWGPNLNVNKYEHMMLLELLMKGHPEADQKISGKIRAFQVRKHSTWKSKCFFLIRDDESADDFSFRKCVDHILPLPEAMQVKHDANRALGGSGKRKHRGRGGKGKSRH